MFIGNSIINLESIDSTNTFAARELQQTKLIEGTVIRAKYQLKGRGYAENEWHSDPGKNLLISIILYPVFLNPRNQFFLSQVASLGIADTLDFLINEEEVKIKWPNDVLIGNKKIAGVLIENSVQGNMIQHSIIGMGINVNQEQFSPSLKNATSIFEETGEEQNLDEIMMKLFWEIEKRYLQLKQVRLDIIEKDYMKKLYKVDEFAVFEVDGNKFKGKIVGLTGDGKLLVEKNGIHEVFGFKEIEMILD